VQIEYLVEKCSSENRAKNDCVHVQMAKQILPRGGDIVFGVAHLHSGGITASLHGEVAAITNSIDLFASLSE
jgi:high-affinity K+ transport system ATPase subunit B